MPISIVLSLIFPKIKLIFFGEIKNNVVMSIYGYLFTICLLMEVDIQKECVKMHQNNVFYTDFSTASQTEKINCPCHSLYSFTL